MPFKLFPSRYDRLSISCSSTIILIKYNFVYFLPIQNDARNSRPTRSPSYTEPRVDCSIRNELAVLSMSSECSSTCSCQFSRHGISFRSSGHRRSFNARSYVLVSFNCSVIGSVCEWVREREGERGCSTPRCWDTWSGSCSCGGGGWLFLGFRSCKSCCSTCWQSAAWKGLKLQEVQVELKCFKR